MKVIGRDIWIGIWALVLSIISVLYWEKNRSPDAPSGRVGASVIWQRFPKFVLGFFAASIFMSVVAASPPSSADFAPMDPAKAAVASDSAGERYKNRLEPDAIGPIKKLREWAFVLCFLCIGLSTRFRELTAFGLKPFWAFTIGVAVNVPLGYLLTTRVFSGFWRALT